MMRDALRDRLQRRRAIARLLVVAGGLATGLGVVGVRSGAAQTEQLTVSGGGVNVKQMPGPDGGTMVPLRESFSFDAHYAQCIIEDNPAAFAMDTHAMGRVVIEAHRFFMAMYSNEMGLVSIRRGEGGTRVAKLTGQLGCATYAGTGSVSLGSREATEPAFFEIEAVDGGHGGGPSGDSFAFTVFFDPAQAPLNHAIFGPQPTFTGEMVAGEVTIAVPVVRPLLE
ncbi:MAG: hypothetical protein M3O34_03830 [Chloroflexota bacterium]|nr:hypothetical protein [Chloroflexota bacterium]